MSLIACPECGKSVSTKAPHCPHCGVRVVADSYWGFGRVLVAVAFTFGLFTCISKLSESPINPQPVTAGQSKADVDRAARYACRDFIRKSLHDPASADLSEWNQADVTQPSANTSVFEVLMKVRAKNAFNATRLKTMACRVTKNGDNWTLISLQEIPF